MTKPTEPDELSFYKEHPKTCDPEDFWGQVRRTLHGRPIPDEQIEMIVAAVRDGLGLSADDVLLDLCCGNGALTTRFWAHCRGGLGVDFSEPLISVARRHFQLRPGEDYALRDVIDYVRTAEAPERFTKAVCYGSLQYLHREKVRDLISGLRRRFTGLRRVYLGNIPDRQAARRFFGDAYEPGIEDSPGSAIGVWWSRDEFAALAESAGWHAELLSLRPDFYLAHYRYDAVLSPGESGD